MALTNRQEVRSLSHTRTCASEPQLAALSTTQKASDRTSDSVSAEVASCRVHATEHSPPDKDETTTKKERLVISDDVARTIRCDDSESSSDSRRKQGDKGVGGGCLQPHSRKSNIDTASFHQRENHALRNTLQWAHQSRSAYIIL